MSRHQVAPETQPRKAFVMEHETLIHQSRRKSVVFKMGLTAAILAILAGAAGTYAAFTATTVNSANTVTSGTVDLDQHGSATAVISATGLRPQALPATVDATTGAKERCLRVSYTGSLEATVKFYVSSAVTNGTAYNVRIERSVPQTITTPNAAMSCTGFVADAAAAGLVHNGLLSAVPTTWATGLVGKDAGAVWAGGGTVTVDYRFVISAIDDATANAHEQSPSETLPTGAFTITWEARNTNSPNSA